MEEAGRLLHRVARGECAVKPVSMAFLGNSHYGIEDAAVMRSIPNMTVVCPADCAEIIKTVQAAAEFKGPMYIRLTGAVNNPPVYTEDYDFRIGRAITLRKGSDVTIIANGTMVHESLEAAKLLDAQGMSVGVINMHTLKPLDTEAVDAAMANSKVLVSAVAEYKAAKRSAPPQLILGLPDRFEKAGDYRYMLEKTGLVAAKIAERIAQFAAASGE